MRRSRCLPPRRTSSGPRIQRIQGRSSLGDVTSELFDKTFRRNDACPLSSLDQDVLVQTSEESFVRVDVLDGGNVDAICETATSRAHKAKLASLPGECTTFARKFGEETVDAVRSVLKSKAII